jgi:hypothetical protein
MGFLLDQLAVEQEIGFSRAIGPCSLRIFCSEVRLAGSKDSLSL